MTNGHSKKIGMTNEGEGFLKLTLRTKMTELKKQIIFLQNLRKTMQKKKMCRIEKKKNELENRADWIKKGGDGIGKKKRTNWIQKGRIG